MTPATAGGRWRRRGVSLADQAASSVSNVLAVVMVARVLDVPDFGRFSLAYSVLTFTLGVVRSGYGNRLSLQPDARSAHDLTRALLGGALLVAVPTAAVVAGVAWLVSGAASPLLPAAVGLATVVACTQDLVRFGAVASGRPVAALVSDVTWLLVVVVGLLLPRTAPLEAVLGVWLAAACAALVVGVVALRAWPAVRGGWRALTERDALAASLAWGSATSLGAGLAVVTVAGHVLGPVAAAALRGASTLMGPLNTLTAFVNLAVTPEVARADRRRDVRVAARVAGAFALVTVAWGGVLLVLPDGAGRALLGATWESAREVLPLTTVQYLFLGASTAAVLVLRVRRATRQLAVQKTWVALASVLCGTAGALVGQDVRWVAAGLAAGAVFAAALGWLQVRRVVRT